MGGTTYIYKYVHIHIYICVLCVYTYTGLDSNQVKSCLQGGACFAVVVEPRQKDSPLIKRHSFKKQNHEQQRTLRPFMHVAKPAVYRGPVFGNQVPGKLTFWCEVEGFWFVEPPMFGDLVQLR